MKVIYRSVLLCFPLLLLSCSTAEKNQVVAPKDIYYGVITCNKSVFVANGMVSNGRGENLAVFSITPLVTNNIIGASSVDAGTVTVNGRTFKKIIDGGTIFYSDTTNEFISAPYTCTVTGLDEIPAIIHEFHTELPLYTGYSSLPDTIDLNAVNRIKLHGMENTDEMEIYVSDRIHLSQKKLVSERKFFNGRDQSVAFNSSELANLNKEQDGTIEVFCFKNSYKIIEGKRFKFQTGYHLQKLNVTFK